MDTWVWRTARMEEIMNKEMMEALDIMEREKEISKDS